MTGTTPPIEDKLSIKGHILTNKKGITIFVVITSARTLYIKAIIDVLYNSVVKQQQQNPTSNKPSTKSKTTKQHLSLDETYSSKAVEKEIIKRGYKPHIPHRRKRGEMKTKDKKMAFQKGIFQEGLGLWREQTRVTTGSERCFPDTKRRLRTTLVWCNYPVASSFIERQFWDRL